MKSISRTTLVVAVLTVFICLPVPPDTIASDPVILQTQQKLQEIGYDPGPLDGLWGSKTRKALMRYQADQGLQATGELDETTRKRLGITASPKKKPKSNETFIIPLDVDFPELETMTKAEIFYVDAEGMENILVFSFDCKECKGEAVPRASGADLLTWASGAEHIYAGKSVPKGYKYSFNFRKVRINKKGVIIFVGDSGSTVTINKTQGWLIKGNANDPLVFKVVKDKGYVYIGGRGTVEAPDGTTHNLGN